MKPDLAAIAWNVRPFADFKGTRLYICRVRATDNQHYCFRYAYDSREQAEKVLARLRSSTVPFETDLLFNYWMMINTQKWGFVQRTTQTSSWYIDKDAAVYAAF